MVAAMVGSNIAGGIMAGQQSKKAMAAFQAASAAAVAELEKVGIPSIEAQQIVLQNPHLVGQLVPELQQQIDQANSEMENVQVPSKYGEAQDKALDKLIEMGNTPFTLSEQIANEQQRRATEGVMEQQRSAALQNAAQRGMAGSGLEFAMGQSGAQQAQQQLANESEAKIQEAQNRVLNSIAQGGNLATDLSNQSFSQQAQKANAQDIINAFNTQGARGVQQANVGAKNAAQQTNLAAKQAVADATVGNANQQEVHNKGLIQQDYQNRLNKAQAIANAKMGQASNSLQSGMNQAQNTMGMFSGISQAIGGGAQMYNANNQAALDRKAKYGYDGSSSTPTYSGSTTEGRS